jgi:hypothetical protein
MLHLLNTRIEELYSLSSATMDEMYASNTRINHIREFTSHVDAENFLFECNHHCTVEDYSDPDMGAFILVMWEA